VCWGGGGGLLLQYKLREKEKERDEGGEGTLLTTRLLICKETRRVLN